MYRVNPPNGHMLSTNGCVCTFTPTRNRLNWASVTAVPSVDSSHVRTTQQPKAMLHMFRLHFRFRSRRICDVSSRLRLRTIRRGPHPQHSAEGNVPFGDADASMSHTQVCRTLEALQVTWICHTCLPDLQQLSRYKAWKSYVPAC